MKLLKEKKQFNNRDTNELITYYSLYLQTDDGVLIAIKGNDPTAKELLLALAEERKK